MKNRYQTRTGTLYPAVSLIIAVAFGATLAGCPAKTADTDEAPYGQAASTAQTTPAQSPPAVAVPATEATLSPPPGPAAGNIPSGPMSGGGGDPMAPLTPTPELDAAIKAAEGKGDKKAIAAAYASRGFSRMTDDNAGQRIKYRLALEDFRTALTNDPNNAKAKDNKKVIEEIYTSMGRPVPGTEPPGPK